MEFTGTDYSGPEASQQDDIYIDAFPNAILLQSSSKKYNCHGYAWHVIEGGVMFGLQETINTRNWIME